MTQNRVETKTSKEKTTPKTTELHIEQPSAGYIPWILKGSAKRTTINPNVRVSHNYSIIENVTQIPCAMSALEVLQSCPSQQSDLLSAIGAVDPNNPLVPAFNMLNVKKQLPHHMDFKTKNTY